MTPRQWYRFVNQADPTVAELLVFDEIGKSFWNDEAVSAQTFIGDLKALPEAVKTIRVRVNSPGGSVFEAITIANALRAQSREQKRTVETSVEGIAASAATLITSAGDTIKIADNAMMMIHDPISLVWGPAPEMRKMAEVLDQVRDAIIATYRWVSQLSVEKLSDLMADTTWMSAAEAVKNGFATEVVAGVEVSAVFRPDVRARLGQIPEAYRGLVEPWILPANAAPAGPEPAAAAEVLRLCGKDDFLPLAEALLAAKATTADVEARLAYARQVRALCATAKLPELAAGYIQASVPIPVLQHHLTTLTAKLDRVEIDAAHIPSGPGGDKPAKPVIDTVGIYAARNQPRALSAGTRR